MGVCRYGRKRSIEVSEFYLKWGMPWSVIQNTTRHEVSHAVAIERYGRDAAGHGPLWKRVAVELGADPKACGDTKTLLPDAAFNWILECRECGTRIRYHRKPKVAKNPQNYSHANCSRGCFKIVKRYRK